MEYDFVPMSNEMLAHDIVSKPIVFSKDRTDYNKHITLCLISILYSRLLIDYIHTSHIIPIVKT